MNKNEFLVCLREILIEQWWQDYKGRNTKTGLRKMQRCANKILREANYEPLTVDECVKLLSVGDTDAGFVRKSIT